MTDQHVIKVRDLRVWYGKTEVIHGISFDVRRGEVLGVIGPAQSGKTSLLRCLNRTLEFTPGSRMATATRFRRKCRSRSPADAS